MTNRSLKSFAKFSILMFSFSMGCLPIGYPGLPVLIVHTTSPTVPPTRTDLCSLLLSVGGTAEDVQKCLTASSISEPDKIRLCDASSGLTAAQIETLRAGLTNLGIDGDSCAITKVGSGININTNPPPVTVKPSTSSSPNESSTPAVIEGTPSNAPIIESPVIPSPALSNHSTSDDTPPSSSNGVPVDLVISEPSVIPSGITAQ
jgi:hypothetical protein